MGSCTSFSIGHDDGSRVCLSGIDVRDPDLASLIGTPERDASTHLALGPGYLAFLLVPALASIAGGRRAAEGVAATRERAIRAACAGAAFGVLIGVAAWAATITIEGPDGSIASLGTDPVVTGALGVVWGVGAGAIGALWRDRPADAAVRSPTSSPARPR
jgi:hypothetical protein